MNEEPPIPDSSSPPPAAAPAASPAAPPQVQPWSRVAQVVSPAMVVAVLALLLGLWQWASAQRESSRVQTEIARRLAEAETIGRETRAIAEQMRNTVRDLESRVGLMDAKLIETQSQRIALESLYQELARNRDEWVLAEIEQILIAANQQLQLAGNVRSALIALEAADKRLAQADRPGLLALRKVIVRDIERLKAAPSADVPGLTLKLDNLVAGIDGFPLLSEQRPPRPAPVEAGDRGVIPRLAREAWQDIKELLRIRVAEGRDVPLLAPEQAFFVRENLKLKLLSARIALLARDEHAFREDMNVAAKWLAQFFDTRDESVAAARKLMTQFGDAELAIRLPDIGESLQAVRAFQGGRGAPR